MAQLTCQEVADIWIRAGGSRNAQILAVAVSSAESGRNTTAVSPSSDYGLWQINSIHFATFGVNAQTIFDPVTNARIAVALSGAGSNWAAWCTCWNDPAQNCGHGYISAPQPGSPAAQQIPFVTSQLQPGAGSVGGVLGTIPLPGVAGWATYTHFLTDWGRSEWGALHNARIALSVMF